MQVSLSLRSSSWAKTGAPKPKVNSERKSATYTDLRTVLAEIMVYPLVISMTTLLRNTSDLFNQFWSGS
jgi:hypothetical protein